MIWAYCTYGLNGGYVFHINKWYETDSFVLIDKKLLGLEDY